MPTESALSRTLAPIDVPLRQIYLDPNNPRFTYTESPMTSDADIPNQSVQDRVLDNLRQNFDLDSLRMSMEANGFLPIDRVVVRRLSDTTYVVLEGNRRIAAAKTVAALEGKSTDVDPSVFESLSSIACLLYTGQDDDAAWIFQGIRHIQGILDWSPYHKARLLVDQMQDEDLTLTEVGKRFGLTPHGAGQWVRGYNAFKQAREESDYINEIEHRSYTYFQELFSRSSSSLRDWLGWNDTAYRFEDLINLNEFVSWIYPRPGDDDDDESKGERGDWDKRLIRNRDDIRRIAALRVGDPALFHQFRQHRDLPRATQELVRRQVEIEEEKKDVAEVLFAAIERATSELDKIPHKIVSDPNQKARLEELLERLVAVATPLMKT